MRTDTRRMKNVTLQTTLEIKEDTTKKAGGTRKDPVNPTITVGPKRNSFRNTQDLRDQSMTKIGKSKETTKSTPKMTIKDNETDSKER